MSSPLDPNRPATSAPRQMRSGVVATPGEAVLFDTVCVRGPEGIRVDVWYGNEHLPAFASTRGVTRVRRYAAPSRRSYLAVAELAGDLDDVPMPAVPDPLAAAVEPVERFVGHPRGTQRRVDVDDGVIDAAVAYPVFFKVPEERESEFDRWYDGEHLPMLLACPQWAMCRRFRIGASTNVDWTHVALHYLTDLRALRSPERDAARSTPWRRRLEAEAWFTPEYRVFYRVADFPPRE